MARYIVGISGASGSIYGARLLQALRAIPGAVVHLILSGQARQTLQIETSMQPHDLEKLADFVHDPQDVAAPVSSGSFKTDGMVIVPCSIKTAAAIAYSLNDNLLVRAADVCLKERRRLVLVVRETPLHLGHLRTLTRLAEIGATILPPIPAFYTLPKTVDDIIDHTVGKALDALGVEHSTSPRWQGPPANAPRGT